MSPNKRKIMAFLASKNTPGTLKAWGWTPGDFKAWGWTPGDFIAASWTPDDFKAAGWTSGDFIAAGWTPGALKAVGWTPDDFKAAGWTDDEIKQLSDEWEKIPKLEKPYARMLSDIVSNRRIHKQSDFGPDADPQKNLCSTPMCTAGHLVNMAGPMGYELKDKYGWELAAMLIHKKSRPDVPPQNFGDIPQEFAMAYIEKRAEEEGYFEKPAG